MMTSSTDIQIKANEDLVSITRLRTSKENHWNNQGVNVTLKQSEEAHLSAVVNQNTRRAKQVDLLQFAAFLNAKGVTTIGDLGKLISPELKSICDIHLDGLQLSRATLQRKRASIKIWFDFLNFNFPKLITIVPKFRTPDLAS